MTARTWNYFICLLSMAVISTRPRGSSWHLSIDQVASTLPWPRSEVVSHPAAAQPLQFILFSSSRPSSPELSSLERIYIASIYVCSVLHSTLLYPTMMTLSLHRFIHSSSPITRRTNTSHRCASLKKRALGLLLVIFEYAGFPLLEARSRAKDLSYIARSVSILF
jgi:hypothetical protein